MSQSTEGQQGPQSSGAPPHPLRRFGRNVRALVEKHHMLALALAGLIVGVVSIVMALTANEAESAEEHELRNAIPPKVASICHRYVEGELDEDFLSSVPIARVVCQPVDPGPESVYYFLFSNLAAQREYIHSYASYLKRSGRDCKNYLAREKWVDRVGIVRGDVLCRNVKARSLLVWSESHPSGSGDVFLVGLARAPHEEEDALHHWWQRDVKFKGNGPPRAVLKDLRTLLPKATFGRCIRDPEGIPSALVAVRCDPGDGISASGGALFPNHESVERYIETFADAHPGYTLQGCDESTFGFSPYGASKQRGSALGKLFCYVSQGVQWFVWTANHPNVFAYAARDDEDWGRLLTEWSTSLSKIPTP